MTKSTSIFQSLAYTELRDTQLGKSLITRSKAIAAEFMFDLENESLNSEIRNILSPEAIFDAVLLSSSLTINVNESTYVLEPNCTELDGKNVLILLQDVQSTLENSMIEAALMQSEAHAKEYLPGAISSEILDVCLPDIIEYDLPDDVPEWTWIEKTACYQHCRNGHDGIWEFVVNLSNNRVDIPQSLTEVFEQAKMMNMSYILFHQGT